MLPRVILMLLLATAPVSSAFADRAPTAEERAKIEQVLSSNGFTKWEEIEFDDGAWEVDDAIAEDGNKYDIKLDKNFVIIRRERD